MAKTTWPDDHPNTKLLSFVESSRQVISRVPRSPFVDDTAAMLDRIESLIDQQYIAKTRLEIDHLVVQVGPLVNAAVDKLNIITAQLKELQEGKKRP